MKLEDQVVSLDLAKKLKELGVKQESLFVWQSYDDHGDYKSKLWVGSTGISLPKEARHKIIASAFTVAELGEMLPAFINLVDRNYQIEMWSGVGMDKQRFWSIGYNDHGNRTEFVFGALTEADARAAMLVYLLENNLI